MDNIRDEMNCRMAEQQERHRHEIEQLHKTITELRNENQAYIRIMDSQAKSIDLFNNLVQNYISRDEMKAMHKRNI